MSPRQRQADSLQKEREKERKTAMTIRRLRLIAFLGFLLLVAASVAVTFAALQTQREDALVINLAGRQRMLIQKMTLEVLGVQVGANPAYYEDLHYTAHDYFEQTLDALIAGGQVPYFDEATVTLPPTRDPKILAQLETVRPTWKEMHSAIHVVLKSDPQSSAFAGAVGEIERLSPLILSQMDEAVRLYEAEATRKVARAQAIQIGFLAAAVALGVAAFVSIDHLVLNPITRLTAAAQRIGEGDLATPVSIAGPGEIDQLARRFDETRRNLASSREEQARLYHDAQERLERISALHDIDVAITSPLDLQATLDVLLEKVTERLHVDTAAVAFIDQKTRELFYVARRGLDGEFFVDGLLKVKEGIAGKVAHTGEVAAIPDVRVEPGFVRAAIAERLGIVSYLAVPLQARGEILGVLELATRQRHTFPPEEVDFFVTLAGQAAIVIDNSRMYEEALRRAAQQRALAECAGSILATLDVQSLWPAVVDSARQILAADRAAMYLYHADTDRLTCPYAFSLSAEYLAEINRRFREVPGSQLLADPRPVIIADAQTDPAAAPVRDLATREGFHSYSVFPLKAPDFPLGAFVVYRNVVAPFSPDDITTGQTLAHIAAVALQNARLFEAERTAHEQAETLRTATQALSASLNLQQVFDLILSELQRVVPYDSASVQQLNGEQLEVIGGHGFPNLEELLGVSFDITASHIPNGEVIRTRAPLILEDAPAVYSEFRREPHVAAGIRSWLGVPLLFGDRPIGMIALDKQEPGFYTGEHARLALAFAAQAAVAIENARLYQQANQRLSELEFLHRATQVVTAVPDLDAALKQVAVMLADELGYQHVGIALVDEARQRVDLRAEHGIPLSQWGLAGQSIQIGQGLVGWVVQHCEPLLVNDVSREPRYIVGIPETRSELAVPLRADGQVIGAINVESPRLNAFGAEDLRLLSTLAGQLATAIERVRLFEETQRRAVELEALVGVSAVLRQARTHANMLPLLIEAAMQTLRVDAGTLVLLEEENLVFAAARGPGEALLGQRYPPVDDPLWQVFHTGQPLFITDMSEHSEFDQWEVGHTLMAGMTACACVPLKTAESIVGLLHLASRSRREATDQEKRLLTAISEMAGNAIHRTTLHEQTVRDAVALTLAYNATIEGWSHALDLRDKETKGHTQRVTEITVNLARAMGMSDEELEHVQRGALLHDIGKMGVPDGILLKPGPLTDDEWVIMRKHPVFAYEMLSPIVYLRPALDIPYCHHEKWDGTGYPQGLKGEQIPLAARLFAIVDVWDALRSDRPYREAWPEEKVLEHIRAQAGMHFDPKAVELFLKMMSENAHEYKQGAGYR